MPDREKIIKGLEGMIDYFFDIYRNGTDSYKCEKAQEYSDCAIDAIALLKEQEAMHCKNCRSNHQCSIQFKFADADDEENWFCKNFHPSSDKAVK